MNDLSTMRAVIVIAANEFRDEEFAQPHAALHLNKVKVVIASDHIGKCYGSRGSIVHAGMTVKEAAQEDWDCVVFVGGAGGQQYIQDPNAHALIKKQVEQGKLLGAICMAPAILAHAGVLDGVEATCFEDRVEEIKLFGAKYVDLAVVEGENKVNGGPIVTANGPFAAMAFGQTLVNVLRGPIDPFADFLN